MFDAIQKYIIRSHFYLQGVGWKTTEVEFEGRYEEAGQAASAEAKRLDALYGDNGGWDWNVELHDSPRSPHGAYFQLFHGRLS